MEKKEFNGYSFSDPQMRKRMKYVIITDGDLDLNGAYAFTSKKAAIDHFETSYRKSVALFQVKDITP